MKLLEDCQEKLFNQDAAELAITSKIEQQDQTAGGKDLSDAEWDVNQYSTEMSQITITMRHNKLFPNLREVPCDGANFAGRFITPGYSA